MDISFPPWISGARPETDNYTEALHAQMFLCDADVAAVHANDAAAHTSE